MRCTGTRGNKTRRGDIRDILGSGSIVPLGERETTSFTFFSIARLSASRADDSALKRKRQMRRRVAALK